jgi:hypothetical protein
MKIVACVVAIITGIKAMSSKEEIVVDEHDHCGEDGYYI